MTIRKPCYKFEKDLLVLARVAEKEDGSWHLCKAHISRGKSPSTTKVSQDFATRVGWLASELKERDSQPTSSGQRAGVRASQQLEHFSCFLAVSGCQIETIMETTDSPVLFESSAPFDKIEWHIHIGEEDFKALERCGWDNQINYVDAVPQEGLLSRPPKCPSGCTSCTDALNSGHADCMRYWHGRPIASLADEDDDEPLRLSLQQLHPNCREAAQWPSAEVLMYAHDVLGLPWDAGTCAVAVGADSINCLSYAHCSGCPWDASVCSHAAMVGSLACLMYAHEHGCEWDWATCEAAAYYGHLDCLVYARTHGCEWDERTCSGAAFGGNIETLAYAFENGCDWDEATCCAAAYAGSIDCLVYAHERGCPWNGLTCERAAAHGHLQCLRYAHEQGCCWDQRTLYAAARAGDIDCLMYAHEHGCPYDNAAALLHCKHGLTFEAVHGKMSLPCVKYVCENMGCSWNPWGTEWERALLEGRCDVLEYIHLHGGAWCGQEKLLGMEEELRLWDLGGSFEGRARCLLYMHCCGGCKLPPLRGIKVGERVLALMQEKRAAVLLSFQAAGRARAGGRAADAVHAAMAMVPTDLIKQIICTAKLLITN